MTAEGFFPDSRARREILLAAALEAIPLDRHEFRRGEESDAYYALFAEDSDEELQFLTGRWLAFVMRKWRKQLDDQLRAAGQSFARWETLFYLSVLKPYGTLTSLAERIGVVGPTLVGMLDSLERDGLIKRTRDEADRRSRIIVLTETGEKAVIEMRDLTNQIRANFLTGISNAEMKLLLTALKVNNVNLRNAEAVAAAETPLSL